jgi:hypothetical protein
LSAELAQAISPRTCRRILADRLHSRGTRHRDAAECPVCWAKGEAARQSLRQSSSTLRTAPASADGQPLCLRHVLALMTADRDAGRTAANRAVQQAETLHYELTEAFRKGTWTYRHESRGMEMTAWRRAAVFLDGGVSGGCPLQEW